MSTMTSREQVLVLVVIGIILMGTYGFMRYMPEHKHLDTLSEALEKDINQVNNPKFPDEPIEDSETLKIEIKEFETNLANLRTQVDSLEQKLAPIGSQDVLLKISAVASTAGVKIIESVPYLVVRKGEDATAVNKPKLSRRANRIRNRKLRKRIRIAKKTGKNISLKGQRRVVGVSAGTIGAIPKKGELIDRLVNDLEAARPLQRVSVEGAFGNLQKFIQSLQVMPWQVTIVKLDISVNIQTPPQGLPQPILAKMIIAM